jgi:hypothetical protein
MAGTIHAGRTNHTPADHTLIDSKRTVYFMKPSQDPALPSYPIPIQFS